MLQGRPRKEARLTGEAGDRFDLSEANSDELFEGELIVQDGISDLMPEEAAVSKTVDENDQISVDFNPDVPMQPAETTTITEEPVPDPEMTVDHAHERKEEKVVKAMPDLGEDFDPTRDLSSYQFPPLDLLKDHSRGNTKVSDEELISNKNKIVETLANYKIKIEKIKATIGPTITLYEIIPAPGIRISRIKNLEDDIALSLSALGIRIIAPIPGRGTIGIEVPNRKPEIVSMHSLLSSKKFQETKYDLPVALGKTINN